MGIAPSASRGLGASARSIQTTIGSTLVVILAVMPSFLVGASGVLIRADLGFDEAGLGAAIAAFFVASACTSVFGGRLAERVGAQRIFVFASLASGTVLLVLATGARELSHLVLLLALGGVVNGIAQPAANLALARGVVEHQALMFGVKQSGIPLVTLLAGASVPLVGLTFGWRWAFVGGAMLGLVVAVSMPNDLIRGGGRMHTGRSGQGDAATGPLVALAVAMGVGTAAATALASFLVEAAVADGFAVSAAGWLLVAASIAGIAARLLVGWFAGQEGERALSRVAVMLAAGAIGYILLGIGGPFLMSLGAVVAFTCAWGWVGLLLFAVVRLNPYAPAAATGIVQAGASGGAAVGPFVFGHLVTMGSFELAWYVAAGMAFLSSGLFLIARSWLLRNQRSQAGMAGWVV